MAIYRRIKALKQMTKQEIDEKIKVQWSAMETKQDLLRLLNLSNHVLYGDKAQPFTFRQLLFHAHTSRNKKRYVSFKIPKKKKGEFRVIDAPNPTLKSMQRALNYALQVIYEPHAAAMGFVPGRSIVSNAQSHTNKRFVYNIDLKNFFPSISSGRVFARFQSKPFSCNKEVASLIADLCCYRNNFGTVLPQGAPTSPTITNIICDRLDIKLTRLATAYGLHYTRYADDITFSGMSNMFAEDGKFSQSVKHIIEDEEHFTINQDKTRLCHRGIRQEVTGITVNEKPNVTREYIKQLRSMIHNWESLGYERAQARFLEIYNKTNTKYHKSKGNHHIENIIFGKLLYLKMVKGENNALYKKLDERLGALGSTNTKSSARNHSNNEVPPVSGHGFLSNEKEILEEFMILDRLLE